MAQRGRRPDPKHPPRRAGSLPAGRDSCSAGFVLGADGDAARANLRRAVCRPPAASRDKTSHPPPPCGCRPGGTCHTTCASFRDAGPSGTRRRRDTQPAPQRRVHRTCDKRPPWRYSCPLRVDSSASWPPASGRGGQTPLQGTAFANPVVRCPRAASSCRRKNSDLPRRDRACIGSAHPACGGRRLRQA